MSWIVSLIIGGIVGWLAGIVMKTNAQMGWIANVLVGVVGSTLGYWIAGLLGFAAVGGQARRLPEVVTPPCPRKDGSVATPHPSLHVWLKKGIPDANHSKNHALFVVRQPG
jgi:uncharacterized membrane protein YeaQ/YmgE (transglycosylase-associated protein family)